MSEPAENCEIEVTPEMIEAGLEILCASGIADGYLGADRLLVAEIYCAMQNMSGFPAGKCRSDSHETFPTKDPEFQKVVRRFLKTPPKPHKPTKGKQDDQGREGESPKRSGSTGACPD